MDYAKSHPGKLNFGSGSNGSAGHLAGEMFKQLTGTYMVHIPYAGGNPAMLALLSGQTDLMFDNLANSLAQVKSGKLTALAVTTLKRSALRPELPTLQEADPRLQGFDINTWFGVMAPAGIPPEALARLNTELVRALGATRGSGAPAGVRRRTRRRYAGRIRRVHPPRTGQVRQDRQDFPRARVD